MAWWNYLEWKDLEAERDYRSANLALYFTKKKETEESLPTGTQTN